jgi:phasin family protein
MHMHISEFLDEQKKGLGEMVETFRKTRVAAARNAARQSAARIKSLNDRVRAVARSGVRLTAVSHGAAQGLIELQAEIVGSALGDAAAQIERMAYTESVRDLARMQAEVLQAARERIVDDIARTVSLLKEAASDARKAVRVRAPVQPTATKKAAVRRKKPPVRRKVKVAARKKAPVKRAGAGRRTARR